MREARRNLGCDGANGDVPTCPVLGAPGCRWSVRFTFPQWPCPPAPTPLHAGSGPHTVATSWRTPPEPSVGSINAGLDAAPHGFPVHSMLVVDSGAFPRFSMLIHALAS